MTINDELTNHFDQDLKNLTLVSNSPLQSLSFPISLSNHKHDNKINNLSIYINGYISTDVRLSQYNNQNRERENKDNKNNEKNNYAKLKIKFNVILLIFNRS